ncbi:MAG: GTPase Era [Spirochaetales bacterium]|nr:GTPase Era [Spirochaetales bacterium]
MALVRKTTDPRGGRGGSWSITVKAAFAGLVGRPSSGKSTFLNRACGHKVSIVAPHPQTTRNLVRGIVNAPQGQLVFIDTPGFHLSDKKMNLHLRELVERALEEVELVLYLIDVSRPPGAEERALMQRLKSREEELVIGLNKQDLGDRHLAAFRAELASAFREPRIVGLSARTGEGVPAVLEALFALAPEGERLYPEDYYTDQPPEFRIAEIIREKAIARTRQEVPHSLYVEVSDLEVREDRIWARCFIYVERESQKGIVVGKGGDGIRSIVQQAQAELAELFPVPVELVVRVKTRPKWRKDDGLLKRIIS